eukprot:5806084-Karenia_brevis.AAC.1
MLEVAGLSMHQAPPGPHNAGLGRQRNPGGLGSGHSRAREWGMRFTDQEWQMAPEGLMSLGDMLQAA